MAKRAGNVSMDEMSTRQFGNAAKRLADSTDGPWVTWPRKMSRWARAIKFMETYCYLAKGYGAGKPIKLARYQKEWLEDVLAPGISSSTSSMGRGNGKSTFKAGLAVWNLFDPDDGGAPQVPIVATTINQAIRSTYGPAVDMINGSYELRDRCITYTGIGTTKVWCPTTNGTMFPVSNDPDGLQGLDPSYALCDEIGFMPIESWDSLLLASGKRPSSLVDGTGTPGFDRDNALWHLRERVRSGLKIPGFVYTEYAADDGCDIHDERQWHKANPALREGFMNIDALRTAVAITPEAHFRTFRLGQWVDGVDCWLGTDGHRVWKALVDSYGLRPGEPTYAGVDVGLKRDSTAVALGQFRPDGRLHVVWRIWLPSAVEAVDVTDVMAYLRMIDRGYDLKAVSYDPRFFDVPAKMLEDEGLRMIETPQSVERMTACVGQTFEMIKRGEISHDGDDMPTTQVLNAVPRFNDRGFTLAKGKSRGRIDAAVAMCLMVAEAVHPEPEGLTFVF